MPDLALLWECGTGKTGGTVNILRKKYIEAQRLMKTLILGPAAVLYNWQEEFGLHSTIDRKHIYVIEPSGPKRVKGLDKFLKDPNSDKYTRECIVVMNYEALLNGQIFRILGKWAPEVLVGDESHMFKNHKAQRSKLLYKLAREIETKIILTGTPILNSPQDIFMQYKVLDNGETFGTSFPTFQMKYFKDANFAWKGRQGYYPKWEPRTELYGELTDLIYKKAHRVLKKDCLKHLPPRIEMVRHVEMNPKQKKAYKEMERDFLTWVASKEKDDTPKAVVARLAVTKALRLMQIVTGHVTSEEGDLIDFGYVPRMKDTKLLLEEITPNHKVILWCCFKYNYVQLAAICKELKLKYVMITGEQNAKQKQEAVDTFKMDPSTKVVIANRRAGGTGINLTEASYSIVYSRTFSLAEEDQSKDRNHRGGSEIHDEIIKIDLTTRGTVCEGSLNALKKKQDVSKKIIDIVRGEV